MARGRCDLPKGGDCRAHLVRALAVLAADCGRRLHLGWRIQERISRQVVLQRAEIAHGHRILVLTHLWRRNQLVHAAGGRPLSEENPLSLKGGLGGVVAEIETCLGGEGRRNG